MSTAIEQLNTDLAEVLERTKQIIPVAAKANERLAKLKIGSSNKNTADKLMHEIHTKESFIKFLSSCNIEIGVIVPKKAIINNLAKLAESFHDKIYEAIYPDSELTAYEDQDDIIVDRIKEKYFGKNATIDKNSKISGSKAPKELKDAFYNFYHSKVVKDAFEAIKVDDVDLDRSLLKTWFEEHVLVKDIADQPGIAIIEVVF
jgi:hypothetical protein